MLASSNLLEGRNLNPFVFRHPEAERIACGDLLYLFGARLGPEL